MLCRFAKGPAGSLKQLRGTFHLIPLFDVFDSVAPIVAGQLCRLNSSLDDSVQSGTDDTSVIGSMRKSLRVSRLIGCRSQFALVLLAISCTASSTRHTTSMQGSW